MIVGYLVVAGMSLLFIGIFGSMIASDSAERGYYDPETKEGARNIIKTGLAFVSASIFWPLTIVGVVGFVLYIIGDWIVKLIRTAA